MSPNEWQAALQDMLGEETALMRARLHARDTTLVYASRAPQAD